MKDELQMNGFQELSEEEAAVLEGGGFLDGIASMWVGLAQNITSSALKNTQTTLAQFPFTGIASYWVGFANNVTSSVLSSVFSGLKGFGL